jgi:hypothetical protein
MDLGHAIVAVVTFPPQMLAPAVEAGRFASVDPSRVVTQHDAALLVETIVDDLRQHPDEWENHTLERFLDALAASLTSGPNWPEHPSWQVLAEALTMASGYE